VKVQAFEGLVVKRLAAQYPSGTSGQELVIAGYTPSSKNFDALVIGNYRDGNLMYAARTRNGFTPASRAQLFIKLSRWRSKIARLRTSRRRRPDAEERGSRRTR
jgi:ATP-dependent DNA ligase